jgi:hypothetical protein
MKKFVFMLAVIALVLITSCKQAPPPPPQPPPPPPVPTKTLEQFVMKIGDLPEVKNLKLGKTVEIALNPEIIISPPSNPAIVEKFKSEWTYAELLKVNKQIPLTIVWGEPGSWLLVLDYNDLIDYKSMLDSYPAAKFAVLDPKPAYIVKVGEKTYWVSSGGTLWKTW